MPKASKAAVEAHAKYNAKSYDRLYPFVPKGRKDEIQTMADAQNPKESLNEFIVKAIDERMERLGHSKSLSD
jgi:predicted HicB family RNase H-like nuclease